MKLVYDASDELHRQIDAEVNAGVWIWDKVKPTRCLELIGLWARANPSLWDKLYNCGGTPREALFFLGTFTGTKSQREKNDKAVHSERMGHVLRTVEEIMQECIDDALYELEIDEN